MRVLWTPWEIEDAEMLMPVAGVTLKTNHSANWILVRDGSSVGCSPSCHLCQYGGALGSGGVCCVSSLS